MSGADRLPLVVLISGSGSNLQALIDAIARGEVNAEIRAVVSNRADAYGLVRAREAGILTQVVSRRDHPERADYDTALALAIDSYQPQLVVLAGFMRILTDAFVRHYEGRMINIHPSLLPKFRGLDTHARAIEAGETEHGCSVHFVIPELDAGPIIAQARIPLLANDTPDSLARRVLEQEHRIYPQAVAWFADGRLRLQNGTAQLDGQPITP